MKIGALLPKPVTWESPRNLPKTIIAVPVKGMYEFDVACPSGDIVWCVKKCCAM